MFTRVVKMTCKPGQTKQACKTISEKVLPILRKQQGFLDYIVLVSTTDPNQVVAQSFWNTREDAERFHREQYQKLRDMLQERLAGEPVIEKYDVDTSTSQRILARKAA